MLFLLRASLVVAAIYVLSPLRPAHDPRPVKPDDGVRAAERVWSALPAEGRRLVAEEAVRGLLRDTLAPEDRRPTWRGP